MGDKSCGIIRFKARNTNDVIIPRSSINGGNVNSGFPYTGNGFANCGKGKKNVPEWYFMENADILDAEIYELTETGGEILRAKFVDGKIEIIQ